jgi:Fe2+ or Zn2+ uptake regulation protein
MAGIPPGAIEAVMGVLRANGGPMRRRKILEALEAQGHRISLAGLNRTLEYCARSQFILESSEGVSPNPRSQLTC